MSLCWLSSFVLFVFFFKQKTAYEMRISDWSSDVCSSDLSLQRPAFAQRRAMVPAPPASRSIPRYRGRAQGQDYMSIHRPRHLWSSAPACRLPSLKRDRALVLDVAEVIKLLPIMIMRAFTRMFVGRSPQLSSADAREVGERWVRTV